MKPVDIDILIVGQGLAGSLLAWELIRRGKRIAIIDDGHNTSASRTAAGLINPLSGPRLAKIRDAETLLPTARALYRSLEQQFKTTFFHEKPMLRLFRTPADVDLWQRRHADPGTRAWLGERWEAGQAPGGISDRFGGFYQHRTGYLDTGRLLDTLRDFFIDTGCYRLARLDPNQFEPTAAGGVRYEELQARRAIFCEGYRVQYNRWFSWLPTLPIKGEILTLRSTTPLPDAIINGGKWLIPIGDDLFRLGATYEGERTDCLPSEEATAELIDALSSLLDSPPKFEIVAHRVGIRPSTRDRRPLVGSHPTYSQILIFNGFGSRGVLQIPWYAARLAESIDGMNTVPPGADIRRFGSPTCPLPNAPALSRT